MSYIVREDFLEPNEPAPKIVPADSYDRMMRYENYLNANTSDVEQVRNWNNHRWEEQNKEALDSLHTPFNHWKVRGLGQRPIIEDNFFAVAGRKKLCKSAGLSGAEKRACAQTIKQQCGKKPAGFLGIKGAKKKAKQAEWEKCASSAVVSPEQMAKDTAEKLVPSSDEAGLSMGAKVMMGVAIAGTIALIGFAVYRMRKSGQATQSVSQAIPVTK